MAPDDTRFRVGRILRQTGRSFTTDPAVGSPRFLLADRGGEGMVPLYLNQGRLVLAPVQPEQVPVGFSYGKDPDAHQAFDRDHIINPESDVSGFRPDRTQRDKLGRARSFIPGNSELVLAVPGTADHVLTFDMEFGGYIKSWTRGGVELLNRHTAGRRGIQLGMSWTDDVAGELIRHGPVQGQDDFTFSGGLVTSAVIDSPPEGGQRATVIFVPAESDPNGTHSIPGVSSWHRGGEDRPVHWQDLLCEVSTWVNWKGIEDLHRVDVTVYPGFSVRSAYFDVELYLACCFDATAFTHLRAHDLLTTTDTVLSTGASGVPGYQADWRRYSMDWQNYRGDDEAGSTASLVPSRYGGIAATGATDGDLSVLVAGRQQVVGGPQPRLLNPYHIGTGWSWVQNRGGTGGPTGDNVILLAPGLYLTNRLHPETDIRGFTSGTIRMHTYLTTGIYGAVKVKALQIP